MPPEAGYYLGMAHARLGDFPEAAEALEAFAARHKGHENAAWASHSAGRLHGGASGARRALLIGFAQDLRRLRKALTESWAFPEANVTVLPDEEVTYRAVVTALRRLGRAAGPDDWVVVYYGGLSVATEPGAFLLLADTARSGQEVQHSLGAGDLHELVQAIPARRVSLVLDTNPHSGFLDLVRRRARYSAFLSASPGEEALELDWLEGTAPGGLFTCALAEELGLAAPGVTEGELLGRVAARMATYLRAAPPAAGLSQTPLLLPGCCGLFDLSQRHNWAAHSDEELRAQLADVRQRLPVPFPELYHRLGCGLLEKGCHHEAREALETAVASAPTPDPEAVLALAAAQMATQGYEDGLGSLARYRQTAQAPDLAAGADELLGRISRGGVSRRRALLVGIRAYGKHGIPPAAGAVHDVDDLYEVLVRRYGFHSEDVERLVDAAATRQAVLAAFARLAEAAREQCAVFYFAGNGSFDASDCPALVCADGRQGGVPDLTLRELAGLAGADPTNLIAILDAGWTAPLPRDEPQAGSRFLWPDASGWPGPRDPQAGRERADLPPGIGRLLLCQGNVHFSERAGPCVVEAELPPPGGGGPRWQGVMTRALVEALWAADPGTLTLGRLVKDMAARSAGPLALGARPHEVVFRNAVAEDAVFGLLGRASRGAGLEQLVGLLGRLTEQGGSGPEAYLNLGVAWGARGDFREASRALQRAAEQADEGAAEARYHLGRVLFEGRLDLHRAVSELRQARELDPDDPRAAYYLGQAIREMVEREPLLEAERALAAYLDAGAPLGHREEVRRFIESRRRQPAAPGG